MVWHKVFEPAQTIFEWVEGQCKSQCLENLGCITLVTGSNNPRTNFPYTIKYQEVPKMFLNDCNGEKECNANNTIDYEGGFQLEFVSICRVMNHMTCYKFECSHGWKIY